VVHEQAAGFVLDALDSGEAEDFERHLRLCPACEEELQRLQIAAAALAFAGELPPPPPGLRRRVVAVEVVAFPFRHRRWSAPLAAAAALAACVTLAFALAGNGSPSRTVSLQLPPPPAGKVYEIWFVRHGRPVPAGFAHAGRTEVRHVPRGAAVAVSIEPGGGSRAPTGPLLLTTETA
jgi:hypothetical protein